MGNLNGAGVLLVFTFCVTAGIQPKHPVILVPGDGGSQLYAKLDRTEVPDFYCTKKTDYYFNIWVNVEQFLTLPCFVDNLRLRYNRTTRTTHNAEGVDIRIDSFGDTKTVEWLDPDPWMHEFPSSVEYLYRLVETLVAKNYTRNKNIKGAPYDWRRAPNELGDYFANLTKLIEDTYFENDNSSVVTIGHSLGNPVVLYYFNQKPQAWKDKYIRAHISLAGAWAGAVKAIRVMASGDNMGEFIVDPLLVRPEERAMPTTAWLMPSPRFWRPDEVLVITEHRNYTVTDYKQLFEDMNYIDGYFLWQDTYKLIIDVEAPHVEIHCLYGYGLPTPGILKYAPDGFPDLYPDSIPENGDGTVNIRSLEAFLPWAFQQKQPVKRVALKKVEHLNIVKDPQALNYIADYLVGIS